MNAGDTVFVQGAGGAIVKMDVPGDVHRRERFDHDLKKGALRLVDPADVVEDPHPRWPDSVRYVLRQGAAPIDPVPVTPASEPAGEPAGESTEPSGEPAGEPTGEPASVEQPKKSEGKPAWVDYAVAHGLAREAAEAMTKADLVAQFGG